MTTMLVLPRPPSLNALFRNLPTGGRGKTKEYEAWRKEAGWEVRRQRPHVVTGEYALDIFVPPSLRDVDNHCAKAVSDLLVELQVTPDDKFARRSATEVVETLSEIHVIVRPWDAVPRLADQFAFPVQMEGER